MKRYRIGILILILLIFSGCVGNQQIDVVIQPEPTSEVTKTLSSTQEAATSTPCITSENTEGVTYLTYDESDPEVLNSHITLKQLGSYINNGIESILEDLGDDYFVSIMDAPDFRAYQYKEMGIQLLEALDENGASKDYFSAIECNPQMFCFQGVKEGMNFEEIQQCIAQCEITTVEYDLPGIISYELRYEVNGVKIVFYAWDEKGEDSFNVSIVKDFGKEDKYIRVSIKQLESIFSTPKAQFVEAYGDDFISNENSEEYNFEFHSIYFDFDDETLARISFPANYEMDGVRWGMDFESIINLLGDNEVQEGEGDDGLYYTLTYEYSNFNIVFFGEFFDDRPVPFILRK